MEDFLNFLVPCHDQGPKYVDIFMLGGFVLPSLLEYLGNERTLSFFLPPSAVYFSSPSKTTSRRTPGGMKDWLGGRENGWKSKETTVVVVYC